MNKLYDDIYVACLKAAEQMGEDCKKLSMFGEWKKHKTYDYYDLITQVDKKRPKKEVLKELKELALKYDIKLDKVC